MSQIKSYTTNFSMKIPEFNIATWHDAMEYNFTLIDALLGNFFEINNFKGPWLIVTSYHTDDIIYIDAEDDQHVGKIFKVLQDHISGNTKFETFYTQHPEYYEEYADMNGVVNYFNAAKDYAIKMDGKVVENGTPIDYSAKYYANESANSATLANNYKSDALTYKNAAESAKNSADGYATSAQGYMNNAEQYKDDALSYKNGASNSATLATQAKTDAQSAANSASSSQTGAETAELNAQGYATSAANSATAASNSANDALGYKNDAQGYANSAASYDSAYQQYLEDTQEAATDAQTASSGAQTAKDNAVTWAQGTDEEVTSLGGEHSAKGWAGVIKSILANIICNTTTIDPGESAEVTSTGDEDEIILNFFIPQGEKGDQGDQGVQGIPGQDGADGQDGFSPSATVTQSGNVTTITIIDKDGTTEEEIDLTDYVKSVNGNDPDENGDVSLSIPTKTSELNNDSGFITDEDIPVTDVKVNGVSIITDGEANLDNNAEVELGRLHVQGKELTNLVSSDNGFVVTEVTPPTTAQISATAQAGSGLEVGTYYYTVSFVTDVGETLTPASVSVTTTAGNQSVLLTIPVSPDYRVKARRIYRSTVSSGQYSLYLKSTINNNTQTQHIDTTADSALVTTKNGYFIPNTTTIIAGNSSGTRYINLDAKLCTLGKFVWNSAHIGGRSVYLGEYICDQTTHVAGNGNDNVAVGQTCMRATSGSISRCTVLGSYAMASWSGTDNIAIGYQALYNGSSLNYNVAIGNFSNAKGGSGNVSVGHQTRRYCTGNYNVVVGYNAAVSTSGSSGSGSNNVSIGTLSMANMASASNNVAVGNRTCENISTGSNNVCVGNYAGNGLQGGSYNVFLGCDAGRVFQNPSGRLVIDAYGKAGPDEVADKSIIYGQMYIVSNAQNQWLNLNADVRVQSLRVKALNTAPASSTDTGTAGEIRFCSDAIYVCVATNTWKKCALTSF